MHVGEHTGISVQSKTNNNMNKYGRLLRTESRVGEITKFFRNALKMRTFVLKYLEAVRLSMLNKIDKNAKEQLIFSFKSVNNTWSFLVKTQLLFSWLELSTTEDKPSNKSTEFIPQQDVSCSSLRIFCKK
jgi:hypothetical protein